MLAFLCLYIYNDLKEFTMYSRIRLKMVRDGQTVYENESPMRIINGNYLFSMDGAKYHFDNEKLTLVKHDQDVSLTLDFKNSKMLIRPNNMPQFFTIDMEDVSYDDQGNVIFIHYEHEMETKFKTDITINLY